MLSRRIDSGWVILLFVTAFFLRLYLAPYGGSEGDVHDSISRGEYAAQHGVVNVLDWSRQHDVPVSYPPLFCYQEAAISKILEGRLDALQGRYPAVADAWRRVRFKLLSIAYDLFAGLAILIFLASTTTRLWTLIGTAAYLFNPGIFINSAYWGQTDSIHSFFLLMAVLLVVTAIGNKNDGCLVAAWAVFALAICQKLQSIVMFPPLATITLMRRKLSTSAFSGATFLLVFLALYSPFLLERRWDYLHSVFVASFTSFAFTQLNAFNIWTFGPVASSRATVFGVSYATMGQTLYLGSLAWLCLSIFKASRPQNDRLETARQAFIAAAYACLAPFMVLTSMHERYIAPVIPFLVLAACLDRRVRWLLGGFTLTYALNLLHALQHPASDPSALAVHNASNVAVRLFGGLLNTTMFCWFTYRLPGLMRPRPASTTMT